ncbi:hypothetical protein HZB60_02465 [candidate division KSB1 bacterium]|nr:hypothetical protein [candidate division KSB1 bacterium]
MRDTDVIFEWSVLPLGADHARSTVFVAALVLIPLLVGLSFHSSEWALISLVFLLGSLNRFWVPQRYRVSETEIEFSRWWFRTTHRLNGYKRFVPGARAVFLSPFAEPNRLDPYRGLWVQLGRNAQEFKSFLERSIPRAER